MWEISTYFYLYLHIHIQYIKTKENQWLLKFYVQRQKNTQFLTHYLMSSHYLILMGNTDSWKYYTFSMSLARHALSFKITTSDKVNQKTYAILYYVVFHLIKKSQISKGVHEKLSTPQDSTTCRTTFCNNNTLPFLQDFNSLAHCCVMVSHLI